MTIIGLIPAGGKATRMYGLPKYLLPTPDGTLIDALRRRMVKAGIADIRTIYDEYPSVCAALRSVTDGEGDVLFAMPDTYWTDEIALEKMIVTLNKPEIDVVVGVWQIREEQRGKLGQVRFNEYGRVFEIVDKDPYCPHEWAWGAIAWKDPFWNYIMGIDAHLGESINRACKIGYNVQAVKMTGDYYDAGTPDEYFRLCSTWAQEAVAHGA